MSRVWRFVLARPGLAACLVVLGWPASAWAQRVEPLRFTGRGRAFHGDWSADITISRERWRPGAQVRFEVAFQFAESHLSSLANAGIKADKLCLLVTAERTFDSASGAWTSARRSRAWDTAIDRMIHRGELARVERQEDVELQGRVHERLQQFYRGVPIEGADLTRQMAGGVTIPIFGTLRFDIEVDPRRTVDAAACRRGGWPGATATPRSCRS